MTDSLLRSLRERALDENEPLAGLLRKCLMLGAETGSSSLRDWARYELNGHEQESTVPDYRKIPGVPMTMDSMSGNTWATGQTVTRLEIPPAAREFVSDFLILTQPVEELERLALEKNLHFKPPALAMAQSVWNRELGPFQSIINLSYIAPGSVFAGVLGQVRTKLVDLIADLTVATPLSELPRREDVDAALLHRIGHVGDVYNTTVVEPSGPTAIGANASASAGFNLDEVLSLLAVVERAAGSDPAETSQIEAAVADLKDVITRKSPATGEVVRRVGKLQSASDRLGVAAVSSATSAVVTSLTELVMQGVFG